ncbi:sev (predicted) [Pycnogonum litorale]
MLTIELTLLILISCHYKIVGGAFGNFTTCQRKCDLFLNNEERQSLEEIRCGNRCRIEKCHEGCGLWKNSLSTNCSSTCHAAFDGIISQVLYCSLGCHYASSFYIRQLKNKIGIPPAPRLVVGSVGFSSVLLRWDTVKYNVSFLVQCKYANIPSSWEYCDQNQRIPSPDTQRSINKLKPYTSYKFRVAWIILPNHEPLMSKESVVISTLPHGAPESAPEIVHLTAIGSNRISISWKKPFFTNGKVIAYILKVQNVLKHDIQTKEISDFSRSNFYTWNDLLPNTEYKFSVCVQNSVGIGPAASKILRTPVKETDSDDIQPFLILASNYEVIKRNLLIFGHPEILYRSHNLSISVKGVGLHVRYRVIFVSNSAGDVYKLPINDSRSSSNTSSLKSIVTKSPFQPESLSVDWLNDELYMAENNQISRCDLDGKGYKIVVAGLETRPTELRVDPYNGYLYWSIDGYPYGGIYQLDLAKLNTKLVHSREARRIVTNFKLSSFAIDHKRFSIFYPLEYKNTVMSLSLYGDNNSTNIRTNIQFPLFKNVKSLAIFRGLFYWINEEDLNLEEYHAVEKKYYHNSFYSIKRPLTGLNVLHPDAQPYPVPLTPVSHVQAVFASDHAKLSWMKPSLLTGLGVGAWQNWKYEMRVSPADNQHFTIYKSNISDLQYIVNNLKPSTKYSIKVLAYSLGGKGPSSSTFTGTTFPKESIHGYPYMLWSSQEGLLKSNVIGDEVHPLLTNRNLDDSVVTDITFSDDNLFLCTSTSRVYVFDVKAYDSLQRVKHITSASSVAYDWLGNKLYWSSPKQQLISRSNLDGSDIERLPLMVMARKIVVDSLHGYIYWISSHDVEYARLNGDRQITFFQVGLFSGKQILGLTLDFDHGNVLWMVRSYEGASLYRAKMETRLIPPNDASLADSVKLVSKLPVSNVIGPVWYTSQRLYWLNNVRGIVITDMNGQNASQIMSYGTRGPKAIAIIDPHLHPYPVGRSKSDLIVVPENIDESSINVVGTSESFNITWKAVKNVTYGKLRYDIFVYDGGNHYSLFSEDPIYVHPNPRSLPPYSPIHITIQASTFWGSSKKVLAKVWSPMSVPSSPTKPRVYVTYKQSDPLSRRNQFADVVAEFRWSRPQHLNGIVLGYKINCWRLSVDREISSVMDEHHVSSSSRNIFVPKLMLNTTYYFQVKAYTSIGDGPSSLTSSVDTSHEKHVPMLLLTTNNAVELNDVDNNEEIIIADRVNKPVDVAYLTHASLVYWLDETQGIMVTNLTNNRSSQVVVPHGKGNSLTIDWIGRFLFWAESSVSGDSIWKLNLNTRSNRYFSRYDAKQILRVDNRIGSVEVDPFSSMLLWTELISSGQGYIKVSDTDGKNVKNFFYDVYRSRRDVNENNCNCTPRAIVGSAISLDWSEKDEKPKVFWSDGRSGDIWSSDITGCKCNILVKASEAVAYGLPPNSLTVDEHHVYWSNYTMGKVFILKRKISKRTLVSHGQKVMSLRKSSPVITANTMPGVRNIVAVGSHLQQYPDIACLSPHYVKKPNFSNRTSNSITLYIMPVITDSRRCGNISLASMKYVVYYKKVGSDWTPCQPYATQPHSSCLQVTTHQPVVTVRDLEAFSNYSFQVSAVNVYSGSKPHIGPSAIYQTAVGAPSAPRDVKAVTVSPYRIDVTWKRPRRLLSRTVYYEIRWSAEGKESVIVHPSTSAQAAPSHTVVWLKASLNKLLPSQTYKIKVRVYASDGIKFTDSDEVVSKTLVEPNDIRQLQVTPDRLVLQWLSPSNDEISQHTLQYKLDNELEWIDLGFQPTVSDVHYNYTLRNLMPKSRHSVRLGIMYSTSHHTSSSNDSVNIYYWPESGAKNEFYFLTLGDKPYKPVGPIVNRVATNVYQVEWKYSGERENDVSYYVLQTRLAKDGDSSDDPSNWFSVYNGSDKNWIIENLTLSDYYLFRVAAVNSYGSSAFSVQREPFFLPETHAVVAKSSSDMILQIVLPIALLCLIITSVMYCLWYQRKRREMERKQSQMRVIHGPDLELATLRDMPNRGNFIHQNNALYAFSDIPTDEELALLPQIRRDQIVLTKFLGSGAFGEVFEGIAQNGTFDSDSDNSRVAVKTLRKGATDQEKTEFLKEAKLMSNFKHEHIIGLLGLCLDNDPNFIILELMEGGDLLSYLRSNRPTHFSAASLTLQDVISICVDVAKGCRYLEEMHFVHRDLAARNCLVSNHDPADRVVKIGDFGLARDIYKNDYYRKEGEGLLPVRWMAPESLVDGVFTSQSDIWAFGVLLWEVMTLGQQPYPARTNLEVLHYVREGGRLNKPDNCPDDLHQLMLVCWSYVPEDRPAFKFCLEQLEELKRKSSDAPLTIVHNNHYVGRSFEDGSYKENSGESKLSLPLLKRHSDTFSISSDPSRLLNNSKVNDTVKRAVSCDPCSLQQLHVRLPNEPRQRWSTDTDNHSNDPPKYLELVQEDWNGPDGYEVPLPAALHRNSSAPNGLRWSGRKPAAKPPPLNYAELKTDFEDNVSAEISADNCPHRSKNHRNIDNTKPLNTPESADSMFTGSPYASSPSNSNSPLTSTINYFFPSTSRYHGRNNPSTTDYFSTSSSHDLSPVDFMPDCCANARNSGISALSDVSGVSVVDIDHDLNSSNC